MLVSKAFALLHWTIVSRITKESFKLRKGKKDGCVCALYYSLWFDEGSSKNSFLDLPYHIHRKNRQSGLANIERKCKGCLAVRVGRCSFKFVIQ